MYEEKDEPIILIDEDGSEMAFEHIDTVEYNGKQYAMLVPVEENEEDDEEQEVVILAIENVDGEDVLVTLEDEDIMEKVFEIFKENIEDEYEFEEEEE